MGRWRAFVRWLGLALLVAGLPLQGLATAVGIIEGAAHVHRAPSSATHPTGARTALPPAGALPPGMPVLLAVDELRHSHGAPLHHAGDQAAATPHHHTDVGRHDHAPDDTSVVAAADPLDDAAAHRAGKRILLDVDTPPVTARVGVAAPGGLRPPAVTGPGVPDPGPDRLERPPRGAAA